MKAFISSVITGFEEFRAAASEAAANLDCEVIRAEEFSALPHTPERACLEGVRDADVLLLVLGQRYGAKLPDGLSPTHQEYREAKSRRTVLAFVQKNIEPEPEQAAFIKEVQEWNGGQFTASFSTAKELTREVTRALKNLLVSSALARPTPRT